MFVADLHHFARLIYAKLTHRSKRRCLILFVNHRRAITFTVNIIPEFRGEAFTTWAKEAGMAIQYIQPGKPNQNAYVERFNRTYREELLDQHLFASLDHIREATHWWMIEYNEQRPHDALGDLIPMGARQQAGKNSSYELSH